MLCLSREFGESIVIAGSIKITVLQSKRGGVMLGIEAPPAVPVRREEVPPRKPEARAA